MASQIRDKNGNFVPKTKFNVVRHHVRTKRLMLPIMALVAIVGAVVLYTSNASSYVECTKIAGSYRYDEACVTSSDEASVVRMYYATLNRAPDKTGLNYWLGKIRAKSTTLTKMASQFMGSSEFKNKYGSLSNAAFVKAMYPQVFERQPDASGAAYWTKKLDTKSLTRAQMIVNFVQSSEMKRSFSTRVALALGISASSFMKDTTTFASASVSCLGTVTTSSDGKSWCTTKLNSANDYSRLAAASIPLDGVATFTKPGQYVVCATSKSNNVKRGTGIDGQDMYMQAGAVPYQGSILGSSPVVHGAVSGGFYGSYDASLSSLPAVRCQDVELLPGADNSLTITTESKSQPIDATYSFDLASVSLSKKVTDTTVGYVESFDANQKSVFSSGCTPSSACDTQVVNVKGKLKTVSSLPFHNIVATPDSVKPNWVHQTGYIKGKNTIDFNAQSIVWPGDGSSYGDSNAQIKVTNAVTGQPITGFKVVRIADIVGSDWIYTSLTPEGFVMPGKGWSGLYVELNLPSPTNVKVELNVTGGKVVVYHSSHWSGWIEESN